MSDLNLTPDELITRLESRLELIRQMPNVSPIDYLEMEERLADAREWKRILELTQPREELPADLSIIELELSRTPAPLTEAEVEEHIAAARRRAERRLRGMQRRS